MNDLLNALFAAANPGLMARTAPQAVQPAADAAVPAADIAKAQGFPYVAPLSRAIGTPVKPKPQPTGFETLLKTLVGPEEPKPLGFIGARG